MRAGWWSALEALRCDQGHTAESRPLGRRYGGRSRSRVRALPGWRAGWAWRAGRAWLVVRAGVVSDIILQHPFRVPGAVHAVEQGEQEWACHGGVGRVACEGGVAPVPREDVAVNHVRGDPEAVGPHVRLVDVSARDCHDLCRVRGGWGHLHEGEQGQGAQFQELQEQLLGQTEHGVAHGVFCA